MNHGLTDKKIYLPEEIQGLGCFDDSQICFRMDEEKS
jgi:hypothetical protein|tara:strand:- start:575 stop:685 length:111 start_codon:yes stop_codon:yes gene_type:complete